MGTGWGGVRRQPHGGCRECLDGPNRSLQGEEEGKEDSGKVETLQKNGMWGTNVIQFG